MLVREQIEKLEGQILSPYASLSSKSRGENGMNHPASTAPTISGTGTG